MKVVGGARGGYGGPLGDQGPIRTGAEGEESGEGTAAGGIFTHLFGMFLGPGHAEGGSADP
ncbi:MAG TPA: hypothetical protein VMB85_12445, partial [Bryobacteraceae bacterium]|nr:hypothetical protein [Bryobacteraceae bacterium]